MTTFVMDKVLADRRGQLLDQLYSAPCAPDNWSSFLRTVVTATGSRSARMLVMDRHAQTVLSSIKHNIDDGAHQQYVEHYVNACPWRPELKEKAVGRLYSTYLDFSCRQKEFYGTEFYNDWSRQLDIHHGVCGSVWQDENYTVQLLIQRTGGQGHYTAHETGLINGVVQHVRRAIRLQTQLNALQQQRQALSDACDIQAQPFAILDRRGKLLHLSGEARQLLERHPSLRYRQQQLQCTDIRLQQKLLTLLDDVVPADNRSPGAGGMLTLTCAGHSPLRILVSPLIADHIPELLWGGRAQPLALVYFHDPTQRLELDEAMLASLFDLSEAEARVTAAVALGESPQQIAEASGHSIHTIRTQLKAAFQKTGTSRQSELVSLVLTSPAARRWRRPALRLTGHESGSATTSASTPPSNLLNRSA